jgi:glycosyltransferase involved in cell wall biosynthesis
MQSATTRSICIAVLAHNEQRRIARCLASLVPEAEGSPIHVIVNGSTDRTAEIARAFAAPNVTVHEFAQGGKSRSWNRFVFDVLEEFAEIHVFADGDAEIAQGSVAALVSTLAEDRDANAASAMPLNGRRAEFYRAEMRAQHSLFGDLYAVRGSFLRRMKAKAIRLPDDLIGDDGLIAAMAKTDLENETNWNDHRVAVSEQAGFRCEPVQITHLHTMRIQYRRMISYSMRHFQNRIVSQIMRDRGPVGLPRSLSSLYQKHCNQMVPRHSLFWWYFDRLALARMRMAARKA